MKKILIFSFFIALIAVACCPNASAQNQQPIQKDIKSMSVEELITYQNDLKNQEIQKKVETYGSWVGVGKEVGVAVKEGLLAVVEVSDKFGKTDVGKFTMLMVAWKVIGKDIIRILLGIAFIILMTVITFRVYRNLFMTKRYLIKSEGWFKHKEYKVVEPSDWGEGFIGLRFLLLIIYAGMLCLSYAIMFA